MTEEEYFRKTYPDYCYGDKPLSPYWDLFQYGVEFGEQQSEKKIEELEKENQDLRDNYDQFKAVAEPEIERLRESNSYMFDTIALKSQQIEKLEKENAELKHNKNTVVHLADCFEEKMKERIEELKQQIEQMKSDVIECFGSEYNVLVARLLDKWEIKEND